MQSGMNAGAGPHPTRPGMLRCEPCLCLVSWEFGCYCFLELFCIFQVKHNTF